MKNFSLFIAVGFTLMVVVLIALFNFIPQKSENASSDTPAVVNSVATVQTNSMYDLKGTLAERETAYQTQFEELNQWMVERQTTYADQMQGISDQVSLGQAEIEELRHTERVLSEQLQQLQTAHSEPCVSIIDGTILTPKLV